LIWQLRLSKISEREENIGFYIIGNLDENGYLALTSEELCRATESSAEEVEQVLKRIQFFDPVGVAARDLRECLLVQLENLQFGDSLAARIVGDYLITWNPNVTKRWLASWALAWMKSRMPPM
jgi:RNA polymerase sigma-54 factor